MATSGGAAASYHSQTPPPQPTYSPSQWEGKAPQQQAYYNCGTPNNNVNDAPPPYSPPASDPKYPDTPPPSYDEVFCVQKPKWNDLWAGIFFLLTCAGFTAVSGISIQGYGEKRHLVQPSYT